jgi:hypothetical protein
MGDCGTASICPGASNSFDAGSRIWTWRRCLSPIRSDFSIDELWSIRGTPEFEVEYKRQLEAIAQHDREAKSADRTPIDWEWLDKVWQ